MSGIGESIDRLVGALDAVKDQPSAGLNVAAGALMKTIVLELLDNPSLTEKDRSKAYALFSRSDIGELLSGCANENTETAIKVSAVFQKTFTGEELQAQLRQRFAPEAQGSSSSSSVAIGMKIEMDRYQTNTDLPEDYFQRESNRIVSEVAEGIERCVKNDNDTGRYFLDLIKSLGDERKRIAEEQKGENAAVGFGHIRKSNAMDFSKRYEEDSLTTLSDPMYQEYEKKIIKALDPLIQEYKANPSKAKGVQDAGVSGYQTLFKVIGEGRTPETFRPLDHIPGGKLQRYDEVFYIEGHLQTEAGKERAERGGKYEASGGMEEYAPGYTDIEEGFPITRYYVGIDDKENREGIFGPQGPPKEPMVVIFHSQPSMISSNLGHDLRDSFKKCLNNKGKDPEMIKESVAVFRYLFAQATPYQRGSAAIGEWFEKAIYKYCGYDFEYGSVSAGGKPVADLDALTVLSLSEFMEDYKAKAVLISREAAGPA